MDNEVKVMYGWICPRCSAGNAPWVNQCNCHLSVQGGSSMLNHARENKEFMECVFGTGTGTKTTDTIIQDYLKQSH